MDLLMAIRVEEHAVLQFIPAPMAAPDDVVFVPSCFFSDCLVAGGADPFLLLPQLEQCPLALERVDHLCCGSLFEVDFPGWVIRIGRPFDFVVPLDRHPCSEAQLSLARLSVWSCPFAAEDPLAFSDGMKVFVFHPS